MRHLKAVLIDCSEVTSSAYFFIDGTLAKSLFSEGFLIVAATFHPLAANSNAIDFPIPEDAPVITTVFFIIEFSFINTFEKL